MKNNNSKYSFFWSGFQFHQTLQNQIISYSKYRNKVFWNGINRAFAVSKNNNILYYYSKKDLKEDKLRGKMFLDEKFRKDYFRRINFLCNRYIVFYSKLKKTSFFRLSNTQLFKLVEEAANFWSLTIGFFKATQAEGMHYLVKELEKNSKDEISKLIVPTELDEVNKELVDWQKLLKKSFSKNRLNRHLDKYPWLVFFHCTKKEVQDTINERYNMDILKRNHRNIIVEKKKLLSEQNKIITKNPEIKKIVQDLHRFILARMKMKSLWSSSDYNCMPLFYEISKRTGEKIENLEKLYLLEDIKKLLNKKIKISEKEKKDRDRIFAVLWKNMEVIYKSGDQAEKLAKKELKNLYIIPKMKEIKGVTANIRKDKSKVIGKVRILLSGDINNIRKLRRDFKKGEILITQMTQPNVVDIASKARALITNEGGMLSHAAIMSREFNIPCIVGTKIATQVLHDGDLVEVDAGKGLVKILKKG